MNAEAPVILQIKNLTKKFAAEGGTTQTPELPRGVYILQVTTTAGKTTHKIVLR